MVLIGAGGRPLEERHEIIFPGQADMAVDQASLRIKDQAGRHQADVEGAGRLAADGAEQIQPDDLGRWFNLVFDSVHDGISHQAGRSEGSVELEQDWSSTTQAPL